MVELTALPGWVAQKSKGLGDLARRTPNSEGYGRCFFTKSNSETCCPSGQLG